jgi:hypothetical protein
MQRSFQNRPFHRLTRYAASGLSINAPRDSLIISSRQPIGPHPTMFIAIIVLALLTVLVATDGDSNATPPRS